MKKLSKLQLMILNWIWENGRKNWTAWKRRPNWHRGSNQNRLPAEMSAVSRSLRRLDDRGLIERRRKKTWIWHDQNTGIPIGRTTAVRLTPEGFAFMREMMKRL